MLRSTWHGARASGGGFLRGDDHEAKQIRDSIGTANYTKVGLLKIFHVMQLPETHPD